MLGSLTNEFCSYAFPNELYYAYQSSLASHLTSIALFACLVRTNAPTISVVSKLPPNVDKKDLFIFFSTIMIEIN